MINNIFIDNYAGVERNKIVIITFLSIALILMWIIAFVAIKIYNLCFGKDDDYNYHSAQMVGLYGSTYLGIHIGICHIAAGLLNSEVFINSIIILALSTVSILSIAIRAMMQFVCIFLRGKEEKQLKTLLKNRKHYNIFIVGNLITAISVFVF